MSQKIECTELYSDVPSLLAELFAAYRYPWEALTEFKAYLARLFENPPKGYTLLREGILIGENVTIHPSAVLESPAVIGAGTEIRPGAYLRGWVFCGTKCVIGNSTELKHCILMDRVQVPHYNYVGDSVLGKGVHLGAGAVCSNLKSDGKNVVVHGETEYATGLRKLGGILGDGADIGCGCVLNPGTVIGKNTSVYPLTSLRGVYPENCIVKDGKTVVTRD